MHTYEEYRQILELWEVGFKKKRIAIMTGINRASVRECIERYQSVEGLAAFKIKHPDIPVVLKELMAGPDQGNESLPQAYAYLLGLYLGDGCISLLRKTYKLRIVLDTRYPQIIAAAAQATQVVAPNNVVSVVRGAGNYVVVTCHSNYWPKLFPQHGPGVKHNRPIVLDAWQECIVQTYPLQFFKGLYHSDGCRDLNPVNGKDYPRYSFSNKSDDIRGLFCNTCDQLGLHWRTATNGLCIQIARRPDVAFLDQHVGPKS